MKTRFATPHLLKTLRWVLVSVGLAVVMTACGDDSNPQDPAAPTPVVTQQVRKNVNSLTAQEKTDFVEAILRLKKLPPPDSDEVGNWYDHFVASHMRKLVCWTDEPGQGGYGHNGPDLLTWHRAFLLDFEKAMSTVMGKPMTIPYWDWTDPSSTAVVFADDFMGGKGDTANGYTVMSGPFKSGAWRINVKGFTSSNPGQFDWIVRAVGTMSGMSQLPTREEVQQALLRAQYDVPAWGVSSDLDTSFRAFVDGNVGATGTKCDGGLIAIDGIQTSFLHGSVHMWVGGTDASGNPGTLSDTATSPNDPVFWLHHANIDRLAESWWIINAYQYLPISGGPRGSNLSDRIWPYSTTNADMAVPTAKLGYVYDELITLDRSTPFVPAAEWVNTRGAGPVHHVGVMNRH